MTAGRMTDRDAAAVEALIADRYLDDLLAAVDRRAVDAPGDASLAPELRDAARVLRRTLVRIHPSFRFEERLAARLSELAVAQAHPMAAVGGGLVLPFAGHGTPSSLDADDPLLAAILAGSLDPADEAAVRAESRAGSARHPLLVGGAITSAAISLVGVAWVAWRAARPSARTPGAAMGRAARAAHARRLAADALAGAAGGLGGGIGGPA